MFGKLYNLQDFTILGFKFLYVLKDLHLDQGRRVRNLAWMYWLPNPLLPFIWFRTAVPRTHPEIEIEEY